MTTKPKTSIEIGAELLAEAQQRQQEALPLSTQYFPYVFVASRNMSLREISRWLDTKHGVKLSAMALSRAMNQPQVHLRRLAEHMDPLLHFVATALGRDRVELLFHEVCEGGPAELAMVAHDHATPLGEEDIELWSAIHELNDLWESIPHQVRLLLRDYLDLGEETDPRDEIEQEDREREEAIEDALSDPA